MSSIPSKISTMAGETEMQHLQAGRPSNQSSRTAVSNEPCGTKSDQLLQLILEELQSNNRTMSTPDLTRTNTRDFGASTPPSSRPDLSLSKPHLDREASHSSSDSLSSLTGSGEGRFYEKLFTAVVAFAAFGGAITFQCIFQDIPVGTEKSPISPHRARVFIGISWLLFTMDLSLSSIVLAALYVARTRTTIDSEQEKKWYKHKIRIFRVVNLVAALVLPLTAVAALVFAALAVTEVSLKVGKTALISVIVLGGAIFAWWCSFCVRHYFRSRSAAKSQA